MREFLDAHLDDAIYPRDEDGRESTPFWKSGILLPKSAAANPLTIYMAATDENRHNLSFSRPLTDGKGTWSKTGFFKPNDHTFLGFEESLFYKEEGNPTRGLNLTTSLDEKGRIVEVSREKTQGYVTTNISNRRILFKNDKVLNITEMEIQGNKPISRSSITFYPDGKIEGSSDTVFDTDGKIREDLFRYYKPDGQILSIEKKIRIGQTDQYETTWE